LPWRWQQLSSRPSGAFARQVWLEQRRWQLIAEPWLEQQLMLAIRLP